VASLIFPAQTEASRQRAIAPSTKQAPAARLVRRAGFAAVVFGIAFAFDSVTNQRYSQLFGSIAIVVSLLGVWPRVRGFALPIAGYAGAWVGFNLLRALGDETPWRDDRLDLVPTLEARLFGGTLPSIRLQRWLFDPAQVDWIDQLFTTVYLSFFVVPHVIAVILLFRNRDRFWQYVAASAVLFFMGAVAFAVLPTNPPWLSSAEAAGGSTLRLLNLVLASVGLRDSVPAGGGAMAQHFSFEPNPVTTIPSIHLGVTALLIPLSVNRCWRLAAIIYTAAMAFALVYLCEHYVLDAVAGALAAAIAWTVITRFFTSARSNASVAPA